RSWPVLQRSSVCFFSHGDGAPRDRHSFPTRRSSDLTAEAKALWTLAVDLLEVGVRLNRIVTRLPEEVGASSYGRVPVDERLYVRSEEHTSELQSRENLVCRLLLEKKKSRNNENEDHI